MSKYFWGHCKYRQKYVNYDKDEWIWTSHLSQSFTHKFAFFSHASLEYKSENQCQHSVFSLPTNLFSTSLSLSLFEPQVGFDYSIIPQAERRKNICHPSLTSFPSLFFFPWRTHPLSGHIWFNATHMHSHTRSGFIHLCFSTLFYSIQYRYQVRAESCSYIPAL